MIVTYVHLILRVRNFRASTSENKAEPVQEQPAKETFQTLRMSSLAHLAPKWPENSGGWVVLGMPFGVEKSPMVSLCSLFRGESCFFGILNCWSVWESNEECTICMHYFRIKSTVGAFPSFHAGWKKRVSSGLCWVRRWGGLAFTLIWAEGMVPFPFVSLALLSEQDEKSMTFASGICYIFQCLLRQINSGFYRTGNSKHSQTITLQIKCNRFILSSIWSITVELSALCPQGMRLSATKKLKTTGMMWCKMWFNHTYPTKVCFQNRKPPCPLRQLSNKKQQIQWEVMYFSRLQPNTWKKKRWPNRQVFRKFFPLAVKGCKRMHFCIQKLAEMLADTSSKWGEKISNLGAVYVTIFRIPPPQKKKHHLGI